MINLPSAITVSFPAVELPNGATLQRPSKTVHRIDFVIVDDNRRREASAWLHLADKPLTLWEGDEYDAAGDYTQAQAEARLLEKLGPDIKAGLEALFVRP
jgi:hypothetical protein